MGLPHAHDRPFLEHAEQRRLHARRQIAGLVEEERAAAGRFEHARRIGDRAGEGPGAEVDRAPPQPDDLAGAEPAVDERVDPGVAVRVLALEVCAQRDALGLGERVGLVGDTPRPLKARERIAGVPEATAGGKPARTGDRPLFRARRPACPNSTLTRSPVAAEARGRSWRMTLGARHRHPNAPRRQAPR